MKPPDWQKLEAVEDRSQEAKALLSKRPMSEAELAEALGVELPSAKRIVKGLREAGANFTQQGDKLFLHGHLEPGGHVVLKAEDRGDGWIAFGFITDVHSANKHSRQDVVDAAYKTFAAEGVKDVFDAGNWIDGEARFNKQELVVFGIDAQCSYAIEHRPQYKGLTTHFISGDDHEGWYAQRERINVGKHFEDIAKRAGRTDLHFLGHGEADVELRAKKGATVMRVMHPGGGSAYAFSYAPQKIVESFQGGEKPSVLLIGHYHKRDVCYPREVHVISGGCAEDQTLFMRKNKIAAHVGFTLIKIKQDQTRGHIVRLCEEWFPFYDRGFYETRF